MLEHVYEEDIERPSIAVHFTSSRAIPAARYSNGTILDLETVEGDTEYIDLVSQWMAQNSRIGGRKVERQDWCRAYPLYEECRSDGLRRRRSPKLQDPISRDTVILSKMLMQVRISIETELAIPLTTVVPVFFELRQNQTQVVRNAMDIVGLQFPRSSDSAGGHVLLDTNAAYAGFVSLSCKQSPEPEKCREKREKSDQTTLFVDFDNHSFSASAGTIRNEAESHSIGSRILSPELGWWDLPIFEIHRAKFWARMHEAILDVIGVLGGRPIDHIVLTGQHGADEEFIGVVEATLWSALEMDTGSMLLSSHAADAGRLVARGAVELAWRRE
ncbi:hypothetical protein IAQ61_005849 [Plenodomus lingam]|nr:hypothetical protein IAQ61_005849 [Plenodomus lingam]